MSTFFRFFYEFLGKFFLGIWKILEGIFLGFKQIFNFKDYADVIEFYKEDFTDKDVDNLKKEVKELGLQEVITFDDAEYKIIGWGDLETRFNDDRYLQEKVKSERGDR